MNAARKKTQAPAQPRQYRPNIPSQMSLPLLVADEYGTGLHAAPRRYTVLFWDSRRQGEEGAWQKVRPSESDDELIAAIRQHVEQPDRYMSVNQFYGWRTIALLRSLRACHVDLDGCHSVDQAVMACEDRGLPPPTYAVASGCGVHMYWLIEPAPRDALPAWQAVQAELVERFRDLGADVKAKDATRVLRLVGSVHGVTQQIVEAYRIKPGRYTLRGLADEVLGFRAPGWDRAPSKRRKKGKVRALEGRRAARATANRKTGIYQLWYSRYCDLLTIAEHAADRASGYGVPDGHRDTVLFWLAVALSWFAPADRIEDEIARLSRTFTPSLGEAEAMAMMKPVVQRAALAAAGETVEWGGEQVDPRYRARSQTIRDALAGLITPEIEPQLRVLCSPERLAEREQQRQKNRNRVAEGRYTQSRADYMATAQQRREMAVCMRAEGYRQVEIAEELGVTQQWVSALLKSAQETAPSA